MKHTPNIPARRSVGLFAILALLFGSLVAAAGPVSADSAVCTPDGACVTVTDSTDPVAPSDSAGTPTYIAYRATSHEQFEQGAEEDGADRASPGGQFVRRLGVEPGLHGQRAHRDLHRSGRLQRARAQSETS